MSQDGYTWAVEGYDGNQGGSDCPLFTNCVKTWDEAQLVMQRMRFQGLEVIIRPIKEMKGLNPYYEKDNN